MPDVCDGTQLTMFEVKIEERRSPTQEEIEHVIKEKCRLVVFKWHRGRPPKGGRDGRVIWANRRGGRRGAWRRDARRAASATRPLAMSCLP